MKKLVLTVATVVFALSLSVKAAEGEKKKPELTDEQKKVQQEMLAKYDKNGDKKIDAEERKAMSAEDKEKYSKAGLGGKKKKE